MVAEQTRTSDDLWGELGREVDEYRGQPGG